MSQFNQRGTTSYAAVTGGTRRCDRYRLTLIELLVVLAMGDGSARAVGSSIEEQTLHRLCGCRDGEAVSLLGL